ncbi:MAG: peptidoglycan/xylan/chitin deacetylase (PgdA/CDA1 family) [Acidimicrobiales bacterium]|jgi:peptidoglycan/xylan/chitin deacetylase (PgdA/CDA1 family)
MAISAAIRPALAKTKTAYLTIVQRNGWRCDLERSVVSMTFDDVPATAVELGVPILDEFGALATFYVCTDLHSVLGRPTVDLSTVAELSDAGHEIGCHTASHIDTRHDRPEVVLADCAANRERLAAVTGGAWPRNFSYPFGRVAVRSKHQIGSSYRSLRSTRAGVNCGAVDLNCLSSTPLYANDYSRAWAEKLVAQLRAKPSWLILYTHGVSEKPAVDVEAHQLVELLGLLRDAGIDLATVDTVLDRIKAPPAS